MVQPTLAARCRKQIRGAIDEEQADSVVVSCCAPLQE
jgi:hypothetical protein